MLRFEFRVLLRWLEVVSEVGIFHPVVIQVGQEMSSSHILLAVRAVETANRVGVGEGTGLVSGVTAASTAFQRMEYHVRS